MFLRGGCLNISHFESTCLCLLSRANSAIIANLFFLRMKRFGRLLAASAVLFVCRRRPQAIFWRSPTPIRSPFPSVGSWRKVITRDSRSTPRSRRNFSRAYLELLDYSHLFFTQKDIDALTAKYGTSLGDDVLLGNLKPAYEIYDLYTKRVDERVAKVKELLNKPMDFKTDAMPSRSTAKKRPGPRMKPKPINSGADASRTNCCRRT